LILKGFHQELLDVIFFIYDIDITIISKGPTSFYQLPSEGEVGFKEVLLEVWFYENQDLWSFTDQRRKDDEVFWVDV
jgi:hypothetical protein